METSILFTMNIVYNRLYKTAWHDILLIAYTCRNEVYLGQPFSAISKSYYEIIHEKWQWRIL